MFGFGKKKMTKDQEDYLIYKTKVEGRGSPAEQKLADEILARRSESRMDESSNLSDSNK